MAPNRDKDFEMVHNFEIGCVDPVLPKSVEMAAFICLCYISMWLMDCVFEWTHWEITALISEQLTIRKYSDPKSAD